MNTRLKRIFLFTTLMVVALMAGNTYAMQSTMSLAAAQDLLYRACKEKNLAMAQEAVANGADVNRAYMGMTLLMIAVCNRSNLYESNYTNSSSVFSRPSPALVRFLIDQGANVFAGNHGGWTALFYALEGMTRSREQSTEIANILRSAGATEQRVAIQELAHQITDTVIADLADLRNLQSLNLNPSLSSLSGSGAMQPNREQSNINPELQRRMEFHRPLVSRPNDPNAVAAGFIGIAARVPFNAGVGNHIDPNDQCSICLDKFQCDSDERIDAGRVVQLECGHVLHASCFNDIVKSLNAVQITNEQGRAVFEEDPGQPGHQRGKYHVPCPLCRASLKARLSTIVQHP